MRVSPLFILVGKAAFMALLAFLPLLLFWILDPWNIRVIHITEP